MASITQDLRSKQAVIEYSFKHSVTRAVTRYKRTRQWIYYWRRRYDGSIRALEELSRRPHSHPNMHMEAELKLIGNFVRRNPSERLVVLQVKLKRRGYTRPLSSLYRAMQRGGYFAEKSKKKPKYIPKPYTQMTYPGERIRIDVKYVPQICT